MKFKAGDQVRIKGTKYTGDHWTVLQIMNPFMALIRNNKDQEYAEVRGSNTTSTPIDLSLLEAVDQRTVPRKYKK